MVITHIRSACATLRMRSQFVTIAIIFFATLAVTQAFATTPGDAEIRAFFDGGCVAAGYTTQTNVGVSVGKRPDRDGNFRTLYSDVPVIFKPLNGDHVGGNSTVEVLTSGTDAMNAKVLYTMVFPTGEHKFEVYLKEAPTKKVLITYHFEYPVLADIRPFQNPSGAVNSDLPETGVVNMLESDTLTPSTRSRAMLQMNSCAGLSGPDCTAYIYEAGQSLE